MIYDYVLYETPNHRTVDLAREHDDCLWPHRYCPQSHNCSSRPKDAHFAQVDFLGEDTRRELVEYWFKNSIFDITDDFELLEPLLSNDDLASGVAQGRLVSNIQFELCEDFLDSPRISLT
jgi:hypothetical protein